jgi:alanine racemase
MQSNLIELDRNALKSNITFLNEFLQKDVTLSCVLKSNAYGHGITQMITELEKNKVNHFSLFSSQEAIIAKNASKSVKSQFMIMGTVDFKHLDWIITNDIQVYVFTFHRLNAIENAAKNLNKKVKVHIEFETGMNRTGFIKKDWNKIIDLVQKSEFITLYGACTHFAGAESIANFKRIEKQRQSFKQVKELFRKKNIDGLIFHTSCSAALISYPNEQHNLVRIGILQYGFWPSKEIYVKYLTKNKITENPLKRVINWSSHIMSIKKVKKDEFVGYGMSYLSEDDIMVAIVPVGYSSGYSRDLSNLGKVIINGKRLDIIGTINMNLLTVDITNLENPKIGQKVILIGKEDEVEVSVASFGEYTNQLNYEVLTQLDKEIERKFI